MTPHSSHSEEVVRDSGIPGPDTVRTTPTADVNSPLVIDEKTGAWKRVCPGQRCGPGQCQRWDWSPGPPSPACYQMGCCLRTVPTCPSHLRAPSHPGRGQGALHSQNGHPPGRLMFCHHWAPAGERNGHSPYANCLPFSLPLVVDLNIMGEQLLLGINLYFYGLPPLEPQVLSLDCPTWAMATFHLISFASFKLLSSSTCYERRRQARLGTGLGTSCWFPGPTELGVLVVLQTQTCHSAQPLHLH